jgi:hypothetical protein
MLCEKCYYLFKLETDRSQEKVVVKCEEVKHAGFSIDTDTTDSKSKEKEKHAREDNVSIHIAIYYLIVCILLFSITWLDICLF